MAVRGHAHDEAAVERVVDAYEEVAGALAEGAPVPYSPAVSAAARQIVGVISGAVGSVTFQTARRDFILTSAPAAIDELWSPASPIDLIELFPEIAFRARKLVREGMAAHRRIKPLDAIHLATAAHQRVDALLTYNLADFTRWEAILGVRVEQPSVEQPPLPL